MVVVGWLATLAVTAAAVLFGQTAKQVTERYPVGGLPVRVRAGIAVSISGPLLAAIIGVGLGLLGGDWALAATITVAAVVGAVVIGLALSPY